MKYLNITNEMKQQATDTTMKNYITTNKRDIELYELTKQAKLSITQNGNFEYNEFIFTDMDSFRAYIRYYWYKK